MLACFGDQAQMFVGEGELKIARVSSPASGQDLLEAQAGLGIVTLLDPVFADGFGGGSILRIEFQRRRPFAQRILRPRSAEGSTRPDGIAPGCFAGRISESIETWAWPRRYAPQEVLESFYVKHQTPQSGPWGQGRRSRRPLTGTPLRGDAARYPRDSSSARVSGDKAAGALVGVGANRASSVANCIFEFRRHGRVLAQQVHSLMRVGGKVVEFGLGRLE